MVHVLKAKAIFDCNGDEESELTFLEGDIITDVRETSEDGWLQGRLERTGEEGLFPDNYVELVQMETSLPPSRAIAPPQLPTRTSPTPTPPVLQQITRDVRPINATLNPPLPSRQNQALSTPTALRPAGAERVNAVSNVALPGLGLRSVHGSVKLDSAGPPALPRRSNTMYESSTTQGQPPTPAVSVRERMANLSMANQRTPTTPTANVAGSQSIPLPPRPAARDLQKNAAIAVAQLPLSSTSRPELPPRSLTGSSTNLSSATSAPVDSAAKHDYQRPDAAVPVPKLTTFTRPRSARTGKSSSPVQEKAAPSATPSAKEPDTSTVQPKLPSRTPSIALASPVSTASSSTNSTILPRSTGPVRFSPTSAKQFPVEAAALPVISRNLQPLPLPSRSNITPSTLPSPATKTAQGLSRSSTTGAVRTAGTLGANATMASGSSNTISGHAFGVKLNNVGSKASINVTTPASQSALDHPLVTGVADAAPPPLPARSNTISSIPITPVMGGTTLPNVVSKDPTLRFASQASANAQAPISRPSPQHQQNQISNQQAQKMDLISSWDTRRTAKGTPGTRVAIPPTRLPEVAASEPVGIKSDVRRRYETLFRSVCSGDYIEGAKVHSIYVRSRLDSRTLAQIWDLVDVDNAGRLSREQFCMGLYLIDERLASGLIPLEVSDELWVSIMQ
ncbi:Increased rDNA silencing protein [Mortierella polycephala]|uniref:Increased rDNA silencing protein n=1 Tax=Mortierella polycephala TaxID=41804 RepID=A0A9P6U1V2_9FUNG|nr:Increased rDNA silencing protein [Mortierella polycephala]